VATALVTLARLGASAAYLGAVGDDAWGRFILADFESYGVDTSCTAVAPQGSSAFSVVLVEAATGARSILYDPGTLPEGPLGSAGLAALRAARILHLDGAHEAAALAAARAARAAGTLVSLDGGAGEDWPGLVELLNWTDVLVVARAFASRRTGVDDPAQAAAALLGYGAREVVITDGERGCWYRDAELALYRPSFSVPVVDTTGAGDVFHGAYLYALLQGWQPAQRLAFASAAAALKCTQLGGRRGIPTLGQVSDFLRRHDAF
jgi:ribokinase